MPLNLHSTVILFICGALLALTTPSRAGAKVSTVLAWNGLAAIVVFTGMAWFIGWQLGGPGLAHRKVLAIITSMGNVAIGLLIAMNNGVSDNAELMMIGFSGLLTPMNLMQSRNEMLLITQQAFQATIIHKLCKGHITLPKNF
jgi:uncharacterized membrane protein